MTKFVSSKFLVWQTQPHRQENLRIIFLPLPLHDYQEKSVITSKYNTTILNFTDMFSQKRLPSSVHTLRVIVRVQLSVKEYVYQYKNRRQHTELNDLKLFFNRAFRLYALFSVYFSTIQIQTEGVRNTA